MHAALETGDRSKLTGEQILLVDKCETYLNDLTKEYFPGQKLNELSMTIPVLDRIGRLDTVLLTKDERRAALVDFKFSFNLQPDADINPAAQAYVLGLFNQFRALDEIEVCYLYPRRDEVSLATYTRADCAKITARLALIMARQKRAHETNTCSPVPEVCTYCRHLGTCKDAGRVYLPIATSYAAGHEVSLPAIPADLNLIDDPAVWGQLIQWAPVCAAAAESIQRHALEFRTRTGVEIPGTSLEPRSGRKTIANAKLTWEVVEGQITSEEFLGCVKVSAKELFDAVAERAPRGKKGLVKQQLEDTLRDKGILESGPETFYLKRAK